MLTIHFFAWLREAMGRDSEVLDLAALAGTAPDWTVADLCAHLAARDAGGGRAFADLARIRAALDNRIVPLDSPLAGASELALFPPVTGG